MRSQKEVTTVEAVLICDVCKRESFRIYYCQICNKDVCRRCSIQTDSESLEDGSYSGDFPDHYCPTCWESGHEIRNQIHKLRSESELAEQKLVEEWKRLNNGTKRSSV